LCAKLVKDILLEEWQVEEEEEEEEEILVEVVVVAMVIVGNNLHNISPHLGSISLKNKMLKIKLQ
jgi:hypothetical protein